MILVRFCIYFFMNGTIKGRRFASENSNTLIKYKNGTYNGFNRTIVTKSVDSMIYRYRTLIQNLNILRPIQE